MRPHCCVRSISTRAFVYLNTCVRFKWYARRFQVATSALLPACPQQTSLRSRTCSIPVTISTVCNCKENGMKETREVIIPPVFLRAHGVLLTCVSRAGVLAHHAQRSSEPSNFPISNDNLRRNGLWDAEY